MESTIEELNGIQDELQGYNSLLLEENKQKRRKKKLEEQEQLYDSIQDAIASRLKTLENLSEKVALSQDETEAKIILGKIAVLGAYIKRRSNLIFLESKVSTIPSSELQLCLKESISNLKLCGIGGAVSAERDTPMGAKLAGALYDFFEAAVELAFDSMTGITVIIREGTMTILIQGDGDYTSLGFSKGDDTWYCQKSMGGSI